MSATPLTPVQMSALRRAYEHTPTYRAGVVPARELKAGSATLAALVRRGYLDVRSFPHAGYKLTPRSDKLLSAASAAAETAPAAVDTESPSYQQGETIAHGMIDLVTGAGAKELHDLGTQVAERALLATDQTRYTMARGFLTVVEELLSDQGREDC